MHVGHVLGVKGHKCSAAHALNDKFPNGKQLMQVRKEWGVRNNDYLEEAN